MQGVGVGGVRRREIIVDLQASSETSRWTPTTHYADLREFMAVLESRNLLKRIRTEVSPKLEITEICDRVLRAGGPALLFENPAGFATPVLANLFGTAERVALSLGLESVARLREVGELLAFLRQPEAPRGMRDALRKLPIFKQVLSMAPKVVRSGDCQQQVMNGADVDLSRFPIQTCWPEDAGPLITWGLVVTRNVEGTRQNLGIYRQQVLGPNRVIMRWLSQRGGALDYAQWQRLRPDEPFPVAVVLGADPATTLAAVTPVPDTLSEYAFAGLLRGRRTDLVRCMSHDLTVPANAEIVLEGYIAPGDTAPEGPFGDHTGYYNEVEPFPVLSVERITHRDQPIYHSTYTGRPPDEPAVLGLALNEVFVPLLQKQYPEITDFYLPPEGCSYRVAVVSIRKECPGHARRIMMGVWSFLRQFMFTKFVIVTDDDIDVRRWKDVIWALSTRMDPARDTVIIDNTPIDYLDFASPQPGLGSKIGFDATNKWPGETTRGWGRPIRQSSEVRQRIDSIWSALGLD